MLLCHSQSFACVGSFGTPPALLLFAALQGSRQRDAGATTPASARNASNSRLIGNEVNNVRHAPLNELNRDSQE